MTKNETFYHFTGATLRNGAPIPPIGEWIEVSGEIVPCENGLHASKHPFDALSYAPGHMLHRVELDGEIVEDVTPADKVAARRRRITATIDAEKLLRAFARRVALDVLPLWLDAPAIVREYLETGDETKRAAAWAEARAAAWDAVWAAARAAARGAAWAAARGAAGDAAWAAAGAASKAAAIEKYRGWFLEMVEAEFKKGDRTYENNEH
jgi:hypothetical protein